MLVGAATSAARTKGAYLKDKFHRLKARRGAMRAALAIAHKILVAAYHMLAKGLALPRTRRSLPRPDCPDPNRRQPQTTYRAPRLQRHPRTKGRARVTLHRPRSYFHGRGSPKTKPRSCGNQPAHESLLNRRLSALPPAVDVVQQHSAWAEPEHGRLIKTLDGEHESRALKKSLASGIVI
jgi:hypothetical protein